MQSASGPWGALAFQHDSVGNRSSKALTVGGSTTTETYTYPVSSNVISGVDIGGVVTRTFTHDLAGNMTQDLRGADLYGFTYNHAGRMATASRNGALETTYTYTADNQLAIRAVVGANPIHYVHDRQGNILAEIDGTSGITLREYIWLPDDEIAPTRETSGTPVARPLAVVDTSGGSSTLHMVHVDHLNRPCHDDGRHQGASVERHLPAIWRRPLYHRHGQLGCPPAGPVVPARNRPSLQLAPPVRPHHRPLHASRPARFPGRTEPLCLCDQFTAGVCG